MAEQLCVTMRYRKDIIRSMESFNENLQGGKVLVKTLERNASV